MPEDACKAGVRPGSVRWGTYQLFAIHGIAAGGMMNRPPNVPRAVWNYYFGVDRSQLPRRAYATGVGRSAWGRNRCREAAGSCWR